MREALFIKKNAQKWQEYEHFETQDPDEMANRFTTLVDDLAYAKTFYPHSKVTRLINGLAVSIYQSIYQNKKEKYSRLISFWKTELPMVIRKNHKIFLFTFIVFAVCCAMGIISSMRDYGFVKGVLGEDYVAMTEDNIANGDPFGVYKNTGEGGYFSSFMWFFYHNVKIDFLMFIFGLFFGILTLNLLFTNSVMLGCFQYMFFAKGLGIHVLWVGLFIGLLTIATQWVAIDTGDKHWQTIVFTVLCFSQLWHVLAIRSETRSLFKIGMLSNTFMVIAISVTVLLQLAVIYLPVFNKYFHTQPLTVSEILIATGISSTVLLVVELEKKVKRTPKNKAADNQTYSSKKQ